MKHSLLLCLTFAAIIVNSCKTENQNNLETIFCNTEHADSTMGQYIENVSVLVLETGDNVIRNADKISFLNEKIYIGDFRSRRIFVFDMTGKLDFIVDRSGRGPQEYLEIKTFSLLMTATSTYWTIIARLSIFTIQQQVNLSEKCGVL